MIKLLFASYCVFYDWLMFDRKKESFITNYKKSIYGYKTYSLQHMKNIHKIHKDYVKMLRWCK